MGKWQSMVTGGSEGAADATDESDGDGDGDDDGVDMVEYNIVVSVITSISKYCDILKVITF